MAVTETSAEFELGPCQVYFGTAGSETTLGYADDVSVEVIDDRAPKTANRLGTQPASHTQVGREVMVRMTLRQYNLELLQSLIPGSRLVVDAMDATKSRLEVPPGVGQDMYDFAKSLLLKQDEAGDLTDAQKWFNAFKAAPRINGSLRAFDANTQHGTPFEFHCYPDASRADRAIFRMGDSTAAS